MKGQARRVLSYYIILVNPEVGTRSRVLIRFRYPFFISFFPCLLIATHCVSHYYIIKLVDILSAHEIEVDCDVRTQFENGRLNSDSKRREQLCPLFSS
jgi:hypothetical protein